MKSSRLENLVIESFYFDGYLHYPLHYSFSTSPLLLYVYDEGIFSWKFENLFFLHLEMVQFNLLQYNWPISYNRKYIHPSTSRWRHRDERSFPGLFIYFFFLFPSLPFVLRFHFSRCRFKSFFFFLGIFLPSVINDFVCTPPPSSFLNSFLIFWAIACRSDVFCLWVFYFFRKFEVFGWKARVTFEIYFAKSIEDYNESWIAY